MLSIFKTSWRSSNLIEKLENGRSLMLAGNETRPLDLMMFIMTILVVIVLMIVLVQLNGTPSEIKFVENKISADNS